MDDNITNTIKRWNYTFNKGALSKFHQNKKGYSIDWDLDTKGLRSLAWRVFFKILKGSDFSQWTTSLNETRTKYDQLKRKYIMDPTQLKEIRQNPAIHNPLDPDSKNPWTQFFSDVEFKKPILQDVERTFPDISFFRDEKHQQILTDILFIYCKLNEDTSYRQGMHELAAPILYSIYHDAIDISTFSAKNDKFLTSTDGQIMMKALDSTFIEHDTFTLFSQLMKYAKPWYETPRDHPPIRPQLGSRLSSFEFQRTDSTIGPSSSKPNAVKIKPSNPILAKCYRVFNEILPLVDPKLFNHLQTLEIEPQLYCLRWIRLLFSREFTFDVTLKLWDGIFSYDPTLKITDFICVTMLLYVRHEVLDQDYSFTLHKLMRFPPFEDIPKLFSHAVYLSKNCNQSGGNTVLREIYRFYGKEFDTVPDSPNFVENGRSRPKSDSFDRSFSSNFNWATGLFG